MRNFSARSLLLLLMLFSFMHAEEEVVKKVVYDLTTGDIERFQKRLIGGIVTHKNYYHGKLESLDVRVVVHGDAYKFFMHDLNGTVYHFNRRLVKRRVELGKRLKTLAEQYDVKFEVCKAGVRNHHLDPKAFYPFVTFVENAAIGLIDAQNSGYAYLPLR